MNNNLAKPLIILGAITAVAFPIWTRINNVSWDGSLLMNLFPIFGLLAFTLLWLHAISGVFEEKLREMFDFEAFVRWTALVILISILLHPLLLLIIAEFNVFALFAPGPYQLAMLLGLSGLILLLTYDVGRALKSRQFFSRNWNAILIISNLGFVLTFFHSFLIGSDLQSGFLRKLWLFYGITAMLALIYTYGIKRRFRNK